MVLFNFCLRCVCGPALSLGRTITVVLYIGLQSSLILCVWGVALDENLHGNLVRDLGISPVCHVGFQVVAQILNLEVHDRTDNSQKERTQ